MFQRLAQAFHVPVPVPVPIQEIERRPAVGTRGRASMVSTPTPMEPMAPEAPMAPATQGSFSDQRKSFIKEEEAKRKQLFDTCASLPRSTYDPQSMALTGFSDTHQEGHRDGDVIKIYQRATRPPFQKGLLRQGPATVEQVLQEAPVTDRPINQLEQGRPLQTPLTRVPYRMCSDMPDQTLDMGCLQSLFLEMGGKTTGSMYPSEQNMIGYHTLGTLGAVRQRWTHILSQMTHPNPHQQEAIRCMLGAVPEAKRAPYHPGVEAFWFVKDEGRIVGFLGRTIETDMLNKGGGKDSEGVLYVTDLRVKQPVSAIFRVTSKGFWLFLNQPALMDHTARRHLADRIPVNLPGLLLDFQPTEMSAPIGTGPQLMKFFGSPSDTCSLVASHDVTYSLACDTRDPILTFEVDPVSRTFQELRNPGMFSFCSMRSLEMYTRTEERMTVPGQKGFARMNSSQSGIHLPNIHAGSWRTLTIAFRMISMPIKETLFHIMAHENGDMSLFSIVLTTINGSTAEMRLEESKQGKTRVITTPYRLGVNHWYTMIIQQTEGMRVQLVPYGQPPLPPVYVVRQDSLFGKRLCNLSLGTQGTKASATSSFQYDVAWIHLYDYLVEARSAPTPPSHGSA